MVLLLTSAAAAPAPLVETNICIVERVGTGRKWGDGCLLFPNNYPSCKNEEIGKRSVTATLLRS